MGERKSQKESWEGQVNRFEIPTGCWKIGSDYTAEYGDGGSSHVYFPLWGCELQISESTRVKLTKRLLEFGEILNDKHLNEPVHDIIDPDLCPYRIPTRVWNKQLRSIMMTMHEHKCDLYRWGSRDFPHELYETPSLSSLSQGTKIRASYSWIPSDVLIKHISPSTRISEFLSPIHNLPKNTKTLPLYKYINKVFTQCIPFLEKLNLLSNKNGTTKLQVIIKSQTYAIPPGSTYSGVWHTEGLLENIVGAIVFYCDIGNGLSGGQLKFRPENVPSSGYSTEKTDRVVDVESGSAVGFSNWIPHRCRKMVNRTAETQHRTFINFFIVDPVLPLPSTRTELPISSWVILLHQMFRHYTRTSPPKEIVGMLMICMDKWPSVEVAKEFREMAKEQMKSIKSGWGYINYGNCGKQEWVDNREISPKECSSLENTDSVTD
eukprot:TRINITY_DN9417_c0_g1_i3.p1 TRINITY_DN9417_c0_g1~~TRINITY_DN9417_c0_g1_i3.p1  ORF type:complete len:434 (-),score=110.31 TRINITY_DN9417_c0_g1_i3:84-1385(-)